MIEIFEFRLNLDYAELLFKKQEGKDIGGLVKVIQIIRDDPRFDKIGEIDLEIKKKYDSCFFFSCSLIHKYSKSELANAEVFQYKAKRFFEPAGEGCGSIYDETVACSICGSNAKQIGPLKLKLSSIPKVDIACTIAGGYVFSEKFVRAFQKYKCNGGVFTPVLSESGKLSKYYYQLEIETKPLNILNQTLAGATPFDFSEYSEASEVYIEGANYYMKNEKEVYKCPKRHLLGLNLLSLPYIAEDPIIKMYDLFVTRQNFGVRLGVLRPEPLYMCSSKLRDMVLKEKLKGFSFDIVNII